ncbi:MAG TPA: hypothetical protein DCF68_18210 [Cyanothece sp. UBA12306]|nr:hypothetical protein [Cyanothece sp. UBA12306]
MICPAALQGVGVGLRSCHYQNILTDLPPVSWFEILSDNYLNTEGLPLYYLEQIRQHYPVTLHGVGMSLGSTDPLNFDYLAKLKQLANWVEPVYISDHLAWISIGGYYLNELLPLPYTKEVLDHVTERIKQVQDYLGTQILIENPASYFTFTNSTLSEEEFIKALVESADCYLLLDVNNLYVNASNHGFNPLNYLDIMPKNRVKQIHLAGYEKRDNYLFDTHGHQIHPPVWQLYQEALNRFGNIPTLIEWDTDIPPWEVVMTEAKKAEKLMVNN